MPFQFTPLPVLASFGPFTIHTWGVCVALAFLVVFFLLFREVKKKPKIRDVLVGSFLAITLSALLGARIAYFLLNPSAFSLAGFFAFWNGGLVGFGALAGGFLGCFLFCLARKVDFVWLGSSFAPYAALAFALGRVGCFLRGCCFGLPTGLPWGVIYPASSLAAEAGFAGVALHPTQLYHSLANLGIFFFLRSLNRKKSKILPLLVFLFLFSIQRFLIDFARFHQFRIGFLSVHQILYACLGFAVLISAAAMLAKKKFFKRKKSRF